MNTPLFCWAMWFLVFIQGTSLGRWRVIVFWGLPCHWNRVLVQIVFSCFAPESLTYCCIHDGLWWCHTIPTVSSCYSQSGCLKLLLQADHISGLFGCLTLLGLIFHEYSGIATIRFLGLPPLHLCQVWFCILATVSRHGQIEPPGIYVPCPVSVQGGFILKLHDPAVNKLAHILSLAMVQKHNHMLPCLGKHLNCCFPV